MAVQAQYPLNFLLQNRNVQEEKPQIVGNYAYNNQSRTGEGFVDQTHVIFSNGVETTSRIRTREIDMSSPINPFSLQPHPSQFIDLQLAFGEQQQQQMLSSRSSVLYQTQSDDLTAQIRHQCDEMELYLHAQGEQLKHATAEKRQRHYSALLSAAEESVSRRIREKEVEAGRAAQRNAELESQAAHLSAEARAWQVRAKAGEATAATLQAQLQQATISGACVKDASGCGEDGAEDAESTYLDPDRVVVAASNNNGCGGPTCKACEKRAATVVLLPCRHLSLCNGCDRSVTNQTCPVCFSFKESSVQVSFS